MFGRRSPSLYRTRKPPAMSIRAHTHYLRSRSFPIILLVLGFSEPSLFVVYPARLSIPAFIDLKTGRW